jgi:hypothetical protein
MGRRRWVAAMLAAALVGVTGAMPARAGAPPASFNEMFTSVPMTVNGSYVPLAGALSCTDTGGEFGIFWYAAGSAQDHLWYDFAEDGGSSFTYASKPFTVNGTFEPFVGDFDADGCDDIFWYAPGTGQDHVWYGVPGGFQSHPVTVNGDYTPLVGDWDDGTPGADVFWYGSGGGTESIWRGTGTRGTFGASAAPQVAGTTYIAESYGGGILFYQPGIGADYFWEDVVAGAPAPASSVRVDITNTYEPHFTGAGYLLYGPGTAVDKFIYQYFDDGSMVVGGGSINGTYRVEPAPEFGLIVFHAPGPAPDYLWVPMFGTTTSAFVPDDGSGERW